MSEELGFVCGGKKGLAPAQLLISSVTLNSSLYFLVLSFIIYKMTEKAGFDEYFSKYGAHLALVAQ